MTKLLTSLLKCQEVSESQKMKTIYITSHKMFSKVIFTLNIYKNIPLKEALNLNKYAISEKKKLC